jgi:hypothetical protein
MFPVLIAMHIAIPIFPYLPPPTLHPQCGGPSHNGGASLGSLGGAFLFPCTLSALTKTGITPPVSSANILCPNASSILLIAPEWLVTLNHTLLSEAKTSSRNVANRYRLAARGSRYSASQRGSSSLKPGSNVNIGSVKVCFK